MKKKKVSEPITPYLMYAIAAVAAFCSYVVYANRDGHTTWGYFDYMLYFYYDGAILLWLVIATLVIAATVMIYTTKGKKELADIIVETGSARSTADEIAKLKELLDSGALSAEEFEAEKKKILEK